jgi:hypothetical protein
MGMLRQVLLIKDNELTLRLPDEMVGKTIEVIAFEINEPISPVGLSAYSQTLESRINVLNETLAEYTINSGGYKFDRNDSNDYD